MFLKRNRDKTSSLDPTNDDAICNNSTIRADVMGSDHDQATEYQRERAEWLAAVHAMNTDHQSKPYLILLEGGITGTPHLLEGRIQTLGRAPDSTVQILSASVSRNHLRFAVGENQQAWVTDQGSSNGTFLNDRRLPHKVTVQLRHGDHIQVGANTRFQFVWLSSTDEADFLKRYERMIRDSLTGLHNRLYFQDQVEARIQRGFLKGLGAAIALIDLDSFKALNDNHGHDVGDEVLRGIANLLRATTPPEALATRHGGEEFVITLSESSFESAKTECERIRNALTSQRLTTRIGEINVTASMGMAYAAPKSCKTPLELISLADRCLYIAKERGRDQLVATDAASPCDATLNLGVCSGLASTESKLPKHEAATNS